MVVVGIVLALLTTSEGGQLTAFSLIGLGVIFITAFAFLEVGLSEDRERAREQRRAARGQQPSSPRSSPRLGRSRDHRRRLQ